MVGTLTVVTTSPVPGWVPLLAAAIVVIVAIGAMLVFLAAIAFGATATIAVIKNGKLPETLIRVRDAGHPVREHKHFHYSANASHQIAPLSDAEAERFGLDEHFD